MGRIQYVYGVISVHQWGVFSTFVGLSRYINGVYSVRLWGFSDLHIFTRYIYGVLSLFALFSQSRIDLFYPIRYVYGVFLSTPNSLFGTCLGLKQNTIFGTEIFNLYRIKEFLTFDLKCHSFQIR